MTTLDLHLAAVFLTAGTVARQLGLSTRKERICNRASATCAVCATRYTGLRSERF